MIGEAIVAIGLILPLLFIVGLASDERGSRCAAVRARGSLSTGSRHRHARAGPHVGHSDGHRSPDQKSTRRSSRSPFLRRRSSPATTFRSMSPRLLTTASPTRLSRWSASGSHLGGGTDRADHVRNTIGQFMLDQVLSETVVINAKLKEIIDVQTEVWGAVVTLVELKDITLPESMQRAMAKEAEAEREKRAKIIAAEGEFLAAERLGQAADVMMAHPIALQLRNLQTLVEISAEKTRPSSSRASSSRRSKT